MDMHRVTAVWSGFPGGPGYSNFFFASGGGLISDAQSSVDRVKDAFGELLTSLADGVSISLENEVAVVNSDTGEVSDYIDVDGGFAAAGSSGGGYPGPVGAVVNWRTGDVRFGRRIRGRTFLVPLSGNAYDDDGTLSNSARGQVQDFAAVMTSFDFDSEFGVWSRPRDGSGGVFASVTGYNVPDLAAVLRSRRD